MILVNTLMMVKLQGLPWPYALINETLNPKNHHQK
jgi:hypothetical protein